MSTTAPQQSTRTTFTSIDDRIADALAPHETPYRLLRDQYGDINHNRVTLLRNVREHYDALPETKASFKLTSVRGYSNNPLPRSFATLAGTWHVPEWASTEKSRRYVNPNYCHISRLSEVAARCDCGEPITDALPSKEGHRPECTSLDRSRTLVTLWERRQRAIIESDLYLNGYDHLLPRFGSASRDKVLRAASDLDIDRAAIRQQANHALAGIATDLRENYTYSEIADLFGVSTSMIFDRVNGDYPGSTP